MIDFELQELRREFLAEAGDKIREIQSALGGKSSQASRERMTYLAHQLKGAGGSYGFERVSTNAAKLEKAIEQLGPVEGDQLEREIQQYVINLQAEIDRQTRQLSVPLQ